MDDIGLWITVLAVNLLWYPIARRLPPEHRFLEKLTFWRWVLYSITTVVAALIVYTLMQALGLFGDR